MNKKNRENIEFISVFSTHSLLQVAGLEPARDCSRGILSPLRLPIPPHLLVQVKLGSGTYRARTCDPLLVRQMLSQLS